MTKLSVLWVAALVAAGCGKDDAKPAARPPEPAKPPQPAKPPEPPPPQPVRVDGAGFATPESMLYDAANDVIYVSNINGTPFDKDGNGFITKLAPDGKVVALKWIDGLDAPKGMAIADGTLYVADVDKLRAFDVATGEKKGETPIKGATFLNDVAVMDGAVVVSDSGLKPGKEGFEPSGTDAVYRLDPATGKVAPLVKNKDLGRPNGLAAHGGTLYMVGFGAKQLSAIADGKATTVAELPTGGLDGLVIVDENTVYVSSWECNCVYKGSLAEGATFAAAVPDVESPADLGWDDKRKHLLIPLFMKDAAVLHPAP